MALSRQALLSTAELIKCAELGFGTSPPMKS